MTQEAKPPLESKPEFEPITIKRALISVADKTGLVDFAKSLADLGIEMKTTSGTWHFLLKNGLEGWEVGQVSSYEHLHGKIKTLDSKVFMSILADRNNPAEMQEIKEAWVLSGQYTFDLVVVNLYQDKIDVGGYALLRAAVKNYHQVVSVCDSANYSSVLEQLRENNKTISHEISYNLAAKTLDYLEESARQAKFLLR